MVLRQNLGELNVQPLFKFLGAHTYERVASDQVLQTNLPLNLLLIL